MYYLKNRLGSREEVGLAEEIIHTTAQKLLTGFTVMQLLCWFVSGLPNLFLPSLDYFGLGVLIVFNAWVTRRIIQRHTLRALLFWFAALLGWVTLATALYPDLLLRYFFLPIPLLAVFLIGWPAGLVAEIAVILAVTLLSAIRALPPLQSDSNVEIMVVSGVLGLIGWITADTFTTITYWASYYSRQARSALEEARTRQIVLFEVQEDLVTANEELARLNKRLKTLEQIATEARQIKADFVARVSHELRAPLNMIIGFSEMLANQGLAPGKRRSSATQADLDTILRNARHLSRLVDDVLDLSQIEAGQMALVRSQCSVDEIVRSAVSVVQSLFDSKGLSLGTEIPPDLPLVFWDQTRIRQILINLLSNAGRFTQAGGAVVRVELGKEEVILQVRDTGPGITHEQQARLFEPFQQADSVLRREHGGSGLGLSISKHFVELHGGKIWLESSPGVGTDISLSLPLGPKFDVLPLPAGQSGQWLNEYAIKQQRLRAYKGSAPRGLAHYILVDEDTSLEYILSRYLSDATVTVVPAIDDAVQELQRAPARAVLINDSGLLDPEKYAQILEKLDHLPYGTPAVALWQPGKRSIAQRLGVIDYIMKPIHSEALLCSVEKVGERVKKILVVDDDEDSLQLIMRILLNANRKYRVLRSYTGEDALHVMRIEQPDLVLLDMVIPDKDGLRILQEKTGDEQIRDIPVMIVSATDPVHETLATNTLLVKRANSLSMVELVNFIQSVSQVFLPEETSAGSAEPESLSG